MKYRRRKSGPRVEFISRRPSEAVAIKWSHFNIYIYIYTHTQGYRKRWTGFETAIT